MTIFMLWHQVEEAILRCIQMSIKILFPGLEFKGQTGSTVEERELKELLSFSPLVTAHSDPSIMSGSINTPLS
jgi:hypothetical protein